MKPGKYWRENGKLMFEPDTLSFGQRLVDGCLSHKAASEQPETKTTVTQHQRDVAHKLVVELQEYVKTNC